MPDIPATTHQRIGNQRPVAAPRDGFGAHNRRWALPSMPHQLFQRLPEFSCLHIVGVPAKTVIAPSNVHRILPRLSKAPKRRLVKIDKARLFQALGQRIRIELRIVAGSRNSADIDEEGDFMGAQEIGEFSDRSGRMADGPDCRLLRHG